MWSVILAAKQGPRLLDRYKELLRRLSVLSICMSLLLPLYYTSYKPIYSFMSLRSLRFCQASCLLAE
ncbi:hypothetical protein CP533_6445 [Ophiocordyceps camponoti-saundersi (nom. inval.)]|nr:hypothetical protein CP533_6445 [Ophiocordyceps camponoti-saundersi (nom. inval.)]